MFLSERIDLTSLDDMWYNSLSPSLPSGPLRSIARFAYGILKEAVRLASEGVTEFPVANRGYVLEKVICIVERTGLQEDVMLELARYRSAEELQALFKRVLSQRPGGAEGGDLGDAGSADHSSGIPMSGV